MSYIYLDSCTITNNGSLEISEHNVARTDRLSHSKRVAPSIYYETSLPLNVLDIHYLQECRNFAMRFGEKVCNSICLYRSPNQLTHSFPMIFCLFSDVFRRQRIGALGTNGLNDNFDAFPDNSELTLNLVTATGLQPTTTQFVNEHSTIQPNWPYD